MYLNLWQLLKSEYGICIGVLLGPQVMVVLVRVILTQDRSRKWEPLLEEKSRQLHSFQMKFCKKYLVKMYANDKDKSIHF